jgi:hypothetical protein
MSYPNSVTTIGFVGADPERSRFERAPQCASAEQQRLEVHRSFRRHAAVVEEHRRRMGLEDRVAPRLRVPPAAAIRSRNEWCDALSDASRAIVGSYRPKTINRPLGQVSRRRSFFGSNSSFS